MSVPHVPGRGKPMKRPFPPPTSGKPTGPLMPIRCPLPNHSNSGVPLKFGMGKEEDDRLIFMEEVDEGVETATNHVEEEEIDPPINFHEQFLLAVDVDKEKNIVKKIKSKLMNMMKIKRGLTVDSGAADHVMPMGWLPTLLFAMVQSLGSRSGLHYVAADGTRIPNLGQQLVKFMTLDGKWVELTF